MSSPWENIDDAFDPMFDQKITVVLKSSQTLSSTYDACIFTDSLDSEIDSLGMDTTRKVIHISFKHKDWEFAKSLRRGDKLTVLATSKQYAITNVDTSDNVMGIVIDAKEL